MACEQCGALYHGNIGCLTCLRWMKRAAGRSEGLRILIELAKRRR
jgi:hypothetical protein